MTPLALDLDHARIALTDDFGLLFVGRILDLPGPTLTLCRPDGEPLFDAPRDRVQRLTPEQFARMLAEEARYQRNKSAKKN